MDVLLTLRAYRAGAPVHPDRDALAAAVAVAGIELDDLQWGRIEAVDGGVADVYLPALEPADEADEGDSDDDDLAEASRHDGMVYVLEVSPQVTASLHALVDGGGLVVVPERSAGDPVPLVTSSARLAELEGAAGLATPVVCWTPADLERMLRHVADLEAQAPEPVVDDAFDAEWERELDPNRPIPRSEVLRSALKAFFPRNR